MTAYVELCTTAAGILLLPYVGGWLLCGSTAAAALGCLLAFGSLRAASALLRKAADYRGETRDEGTGPAPERNAPGPFPHARAGLFELALFFGGVAAALCVLPAHAAAAGWAAATAGRVAVRRMLERRYAQIAAFVPVAFVAAAAALIWVPPDPAFQIARTVSATIVMSAGAAGIGVSILLFRWRVSRRLSLPAAMGVAVWSLTWIFARGEEFGHNPVIVAWGVGVGVAVALTGLAMRATDGPGAGVVLFLVSRIYGLVGWQAALPYVAQTVCGWRPRFGWGRGDPHGAAPHGAADEAATGALPLALVGAYFTFTHGAFLSAYLASCAAATASRLSGILRRSPRARVATATLTVVALCAIPALFARYPHCDARAVGAAVAGGLMAWLAGEALHAKAPGWAELSGVVRRATVSAVAAVFATCVVAVAAIWGR